MLGATATISSIRVYSSRSPYFDLGGYGTTGVFSQDDSIHSITVSASISDSLLSMSDGSMTITVMGGSTTNTLNVRSGCTITLSIECGQTFGKSTATLMPNSLNAGASMTVSLSNPKISDLRHDIEWTFGRHTNRQSISTGVTQGAYAIPISWIDTIPSAISGTGSVTVYTYAGSTYIGSASYTFTLNVPDNIVPSIGSLTATQINNDVPVSWGIYVQNRSGVRLTANNAAGTYGSTISSYTFGGNINNTQTSNVLTISPIGGSGTITYTVFATDSRGRASAPASVSIAVNPYSSPTLTSGVAFRCNANGESNEEGTFIGARAEAQFTSLNGKNTLTVSCFYQKLGDTTWTTGQNPMMIGTTYVFGNGKIAVNSTYHV